MCSRKVRMKILLCNKFYYRRGGDCIYTINLANLLTSHGHSVALFAMEHTETLDNPWRGYFPPEVGFDGLGAKLKYFARCLGDRDTVGRFRKVLDVFQPDVVHLNNIHSQLSPIIAVEAHRRGIKVVWTLHDYKLLCPRYDCLLRGESICERCFKDKTQVLRRKCMKNSLAASTLAYFEAIKWNRAVLEKNTDIFVCPSRFMADKMAQGSFPKEKLVHLCNFIDAGLCERDDYSERGDYYCFVGRLSHEKGVATLVEAAKRLPHKLVVVGDGPLKGSLPAASNIEFVGRKDWSQIKVIVGKARFTVIPSEWYENNPLSVIEALSLGTPVLGADIGGIPELIDGQSGICFKSGDVSSLCAAIEQMYAQRFDYESIAERSLGRFSAEEYYSKLIDIYN